MKRFSSRRNRFNPRRLDNFEVRWGALLCLLPYLVTALFGHGLHTHAPSTEQIQLSSFVVASGLDELAFVDESEPAKSSGQSAIWSPLAHATSSDSPCLLCLWASSSVGALSASASEFRSSRRVEVRACSLAVVLVSASIPSRQNRGPPLS